MALHPDFPSDPYAILNPDLRWFPADELLRTQGYEKLLPPLVAILRKKVRLKYICKTRYIEDEKRIPDDVLDYVNQMWKEHGYPLQVK